MDGHGTDLITVCIYSILKLESGQLNQMCGAPMCGRFAQYRIAYEYLDKIAMQLPLPLRGSVNPEPIGRYNVCPQSLVQLLHQDDDGLRMEPVKWGYAPLWAQGSDHQR